jgi:hypothetical protein
LVARRSCAPVVLACLAFLLACRSCPLVVLAILSFLCARRSCLLVVRFVLLPGPCCLGRAHELGDGLVVVAQWSVWPRARLLRSRAGARARLLRRARGDRRVHSGQPVQVVKGFARAGQDWRSCHVWGSGRGDVLVVQLVLQPGPCRLGRVNGLGDQLVVVCVVVGLATGAPAAQSGWGKGPAAAASAR